MQIDSIHVRNYRCLQDLEITELSPITIVLGRNNTGKSALVEAMALIAAARSSWYDSLGHDLLENIIDTRGGWNHADLMIRIGAETAEIEAGGEQIDGNLRITKDRRSLAEDLRSSILKSIDDHLNETYIDELDRMTRGKRYESGTRTEIAVRNLDDKFSAARKKALELVNLNVAYRSIKKKHLETASIFAEIPEMVQDSNYVDFVPTEEIVRSSRERESNVMLLDKPSHDDLLEIERRLTRMGRLGDLIRRTREEIDYFEDMREIEEDLLVSVAEAKRPLPLGAMGEGLALVLVLIAAAEISRNGIILVEEPETCLHPGFMSIVADHIVRSAKNNKTQYILSSHSIEFTEILLKAAKEDVKIVRFYRSKETVGKDYEILNRSEAIYEMESLRTDLRGA